MIQNDVGQEKNATAMFCIETILFGLAAITQNLTLYALADELGLWLIYFYSRLNRVDVIYRSY